MVSSTFITVTFQYQIYIEIYYKYICYTNATERSHMVMKCKEEWCLLGCYAVWLL
jgi:hypothetical protein